jgi:hypothetical protein
MPDLFSISIFNLNIGIMIILEQKRSDRSLPWKVLKTDKNIARQAD